MDREKIQTGAAGAAAGAVLLALVGFTWGGWVTASTAAGMATKAATEAKVAALLPHCLAMAEADPMAEQIMTELKAARATARRGVVEKAGWATPLGTDAPNRDLAEACQRVLAEA